MFIFQTSEEVSTGAKVMIKWNALKNLSVIGLSSLVVYVSFLIEAGKIISKFYAMMVVLSPGLKMRIIKEIMNGNKRRLYTS
ncbi:MAG: hypothetical protein LBI98_00775 [Endomicrobium sp.]|nr:hypothetical protein [Endomicrobium sp.]